MNRVKFRPNDSKTAMLIESGSNTLGENLHSAWSYSCYDGTNPTTLSLLKNGVVLNTANNDSTETTLNYGTIGNPERIGHYANIYSIRADISHYRVRKYAATAEELLYEKNQLMTPGNLLTFGEEESKRSLPVIFLSAGAV
jgi:hypothetical protein